MTNSQRLAVVRARLIRWLADHRGDGADVQEEQIAESILIRGGFYCGRRFDAGSHQAVWFMEEDELKIYSDSGRLLCVMNETQISEQPAATAPIDPPQVESESSREPDIIKLPAASDDDDLRRAA